MQEWEVKLDGMLIQLTTNINHNTNTKFDAATDNIIHHTVNIQEVIGKMATEFQLSQQKMCALTQNLAMSLPSLYQRLPASNQQGPSTSTHTGATHFNFKLHLATTVHLNTATHKTSINATTLLMNTSLPILSQWTTFPNPPTKIFTLGQNDVFQ